MYYDIESLMTFGGEPLLYPDTVCCIHRAAALAGIPERELITNGFFSRNSGKIKEVADMITESGVNRLLLSVDAFHQETIPIEPVEFFADCIKSSGVHIELSPAWLVSTERRSSGSPGSGSAADEGQGQDTSTYDDASRRCTSRRSH